MSEEANSTLTVEILLTGYVAAQPTIITYTVKNVTNKHVLISAGCHHIARDMAEAQGISMRELLDRMIRYFEQTGFDPAQVELHENVQLFEKLKILFRDFAESQGDGLLKESQNRRALISEFEAYIAGYINALASREEQARKKKTLGLVILQTLEPAMAEPPRSSANLLL